MQLTQYRMVILAVIAATVLLLVSPIIQGFFPASETIPFTEMSLLGDNHQAIYPSNISSGELNRFYLEVTNHMGNAVYYEIHTKFGGPNDSGPDSFRHKNSNLEAIDVMFFEAVNNQSVEFPLDVSFDYSIDDAASELHLMNLTINGEPLNVEDKTIEWDLERKGYYGNLFFELWIQNDTVNTLQYHQRYVSLWFKFNQ